MHRKTKAGNLIHQRAIVILSADYPEEAVQHALSAQTANALQALVNTICYED